MLVALLRAFVHRSEAAQKGHAIAAYNVGVQFLEGEGAPQDFKKALAWLETAAKMGFVSQLAPTFCCYCPMNVYALTGRSLTGSQIEAKINIAYMYLEVRTLALTVT